MVHVPDEKLIHLEVLSIDTREICVIEKDLCKIECFRKGNSFQTVLSVTFSKEKCVLGGNTV